jgi:nitrite reductase (cytochrome c-552)
LPGLKWRKAILNHRNFGILFILVLLAGLVGTGALFYRNAEPRQENTLLEPEDWADDLEAWGKKHPLQYESHLRTVDQAGTRFGGSEIVTRTPGEKDPRPFLSQSKLDEDPRLKLLWAGYPYSADFRESRGHAFMLDDLTHVSGGADIPSGCLHCHASVSLLSRRLGGADPAGSLEEISRMPFSEARRLVEHPVACIDCHDPATMALRVTRPVFLEGMRDLKASEGVFGYDVNRDASPQEMRSFVCGQCHSEYYLKGSGNRPAHPWAKGLRVEDILDYYDESGFADWTHQTGARVLKAQHPEFEMWRQGLHAQSGVACADCHMPPRRDGPQASDHHVRSPLLNLTRSCRSCHRWADEEARRRAESIQERTFLLKDEAVDALVELIEDLKAARASGGKDLARALEYQRRSQFYLDFVEAENSTGFHASREAARILNESIRLSRLGRATLR